MPTNERCRRIRERHYPRRQWPGMIYESTVSSLGRPDAILLEIGCGRQAKRMCRLAQHYRMGIGFDIETVHRPAQPNAWLLQGDAHQLPFADATLDVVACANVMEHLAEPERAFEEAVRVLRPDGRFIIMTVNQWFLPIAAARIMPHRFRQWANRLASGTQEEDTFPAYYRANTASSLRRHAATAGLRVERIENVCHHPHYLMFSVLAYRTGILLEKLTRPCAGLRHMIIAQFVKPSADNRMETGRE